MTCPECGNNDQAKMMGFEVRGVYDGVLWWMCQSCGWGFPRDFGPGRRSDLSRQYADEHNAAGTAGETRPWKAPTDPESDPAIRRGR